VIIIYFLTGKVFPIGIHLWNIGNLDILICTILPMC
jgi:hypothetical protein